jgi:hypothetical protein
VFRRYTYTRLLYTHNGMDPNIYSHGSRSLPHNQAHLHHTLTCSLYMGHSLHNLLSLPAPTPTTSSRGAQAVFRANSFQALYSTSYLLAYGDRTQCSKRWYLNYRCQGITRNKAYYIINLFGKVFALSLCNPSSLPDEVPLHGFLSFPPFLTQQQQDTQILTLTSLKIKCGRTKFQMYPFICLLYHNALLTQTVSKAQPATIHWVQRTINQMFLRPVCEADLSLHVIP